MYVGVRCDEKLASLQWTISRSTMKRGFSPWSRRGLHVTNFKKQNKKKCELNVSHVIFRIYVCFGRQEKLANFDVSNNRSVMKRSLPTEEKWDMNLWKQKVGKCACQVDVWDGCLTRDFLHSRQLWTQQEAGKLRCDPHEKPDLVKSVHWRKNKCNHTWSQIQWKYSVVSKGCRTFGLLHQRQLWTQPETCKLRRCIQEKPNEEESFRWRKPRSKSVKTKAQKEHSWQITFPSWNERTAGSRWNGASQVQDRP